MSCAVAAFSDESERGQALARALGAPFAPINVHRFPEGETMPTVSAPASETTVLYRSLDRPNRKLADLLLAADAFRRAGVRRLILVAPYFCYLRQDAVFAPGQPLSRDVIGPLIGTRFSAVITVQAHLHRTSDLAAALGTRALNLSPIEPLAAALPEEDRPIIVGPDVESKPWVEAWARRLAGRAVVLHKTRRSDDQVSVERPPMDVAGRSVVIVDDVASSGGTLARAAALVHKAGASSIDVAVVHALTSGPATQRILNAGARRIVSTDSVPHPTNVAKLAPMLADAVRQALAA